MDFSGYFFAFGAAIVFLVMPPLVIASKWRELEPGARRGLITVYLILLAAVAVLVVGIHHWASSGL